MHTRSFIVCIAATTYVYQATILINISRIFVVRFICAAFNLFVGLSFRLSMWMLSHSILFSFFVHLDYGCCSCCSSLVRYICVVVSQATDYYYSFSLSSSSMWLIYLHSYFVCVCVYISTNNIIESCPMMTYIFVATICKLIVRKHTCTHLFKYACHHELGSSSPLLVIACIFILIEQGAFYYLELSFLCCTDVFNAPFRQFYGAHWTIYMLYSK